MIPSNAVSWLCALLLVILLVGVSWTYSFGLHGPFLLDDFHVLKPLFKYSLNLDDLRKAIAFNTSGIHPLSRATPILSFVVTGELYGDHVLGFKLHNIIIHLVCGVFVFLFSYKIIKTCSDSTRHPQLCALFITAFWLLHPLHVSSVLYVVQRIAQLSTLFTLISLSTFIYARMTDNRAVKRVFYFFLFPLFVLLGLTSKENAALVFLFIVLTEVLIRNQAHAVSRTTSDRRFFNFLILAPLFIGTAAFIYVSPSLLDYSSRNFSLGDRVLTQIYFVAFYVKQLVLPNLSSMGLYFDDVPVQYSLSLKILLLALVHATLLAYGIFILKKGSLIGYGILFFYIGHLLESTIVPLEMAFEHRNYLPSVGMGIALGSLIFNRSSALLKVLASTTIIILLAGLLFIRVGFWSNEREWQQTNYTFHQQSVRSRLSYIAFLLYNREYEELSKQIARAESDFPKEPTFLLSRLSLECNTTDTVEDGNRVLSHSIKLIEESGLTVGRLSAISTLVLSYTENACTNFSSNALYELTDRTIALEIKKLNSRYLGHLYAIKAMLRVKDNQFLAANQLMLKAYQLTQRREYLLRAANTLFFRLDHLELAEELLADIKNGTYLDPTLFDEEIILIENDILELHKLRQSTTN